MSTPITLTEHAPRRVGTRRWVSLAAAIVFVVLILTVAIGWAPAWAAQRKYAPQAGDVLFQSLPHSALVNAIEGATRSPLSHCGIVGIRNGQWVVYEAFDGVEITPLNEFLWRGRGAGFAAYRLKEPHQGHVQPTLTEAAKFLGRPYDSRYRMDDERIYCSELVFKAYRAATGEDLGKLVTLGELNWQPYERTIRYLDGGGLPLDRQMITPRDLAQAEQLELVFAYNLATAEK